ncbi:glycosyltransferase [Nocardia sp. NBC_01377]|uniref:glycosyltransferase family 2 protein n=1 Tax=Nocardia sp. NBC_01377 TaxID=2903595 RepID=UPI0032541CD8
MKDSPPPVTVVVPAHNARAFLAEAVESVLAQDFTDYELLIVDDGSTDGTAEIAGGYRDPRVVVVRRTWEGVVGAANHALDRARGEFVARLDADDVMLPGRLAAQVAYLRGHAGVVAVGTDYRLFGDSAGRVRMPRSDRACRQRLLLSSCFAHSTVMMRRKVLSDNGIRYAPETGGLGEDYALWCELSAYGAFANLPILGAAYRVHPAQASDRRWPELLDSYCAIARAHAARTGHPALESDELLALLAPVDAATPVDSRTVARAAWHALRRAPGIETTRFVAANAARRMREARAARRT